MNTSFRQLRLFLALAEQGSVSAAARAMHVTQPTASMQLREISDAAGEISSPHFPDSYPAKKDCVWIFSTTPGHRIKLVRISGWVGVERKFNLITLIKQTD